MIAVRQGWLLFLLCLIVPGLARAAEDATQSVQGDAFAPPVDPMRLTRTLHQPLPDGAQIVVRRAYAVRFRPKDDGFEIEGRQIEVSVEAPAALEAFAALERSRVDNGCFPIALDRHGAIAATPHRQTPPPSTQAIVRVRKEIAALGLPHGTAADALALVARFERQPAVTPWPTDLFHPSPGRHRQERSIALATGERGDVVIETEATALPSGLLKTLSRTVTTRFAGDARTVRETWTLDDQK